MGEQYADLKNRPCDAFRYGVDPAPPWFFGFVFDAPPLDQPRAIATHTGVKRIKAGDWVIMEFDERVFACSNVVFSELYKKAEAKNG